MCIFACYVHLLALITSCFGVVASWPQRLFETRAKVAKRGWDALASLSHPSENLEVLDFPKLLSSWEALDEWRFARIGALTAYDRACEKVSRFWASRLWTCPLLPLKGQCCVVLMLSSY